FFEQRHRDADRFWFSILKPSLRSLQDPDHPLGHWPRGVFGNGLREDDFTSAPAHGLRIVRIDQTVLGKESHILDSVELLLRLLRRWFHSKDDLVSFALCFDAPVFCIPRNVGETLREERAPTAIRRSFFRGDWKLDA